MAELTCPPLPTGSVDFDALHAAAKKAKTVDDLVKAAEKATTRAGAEVEAPAQVSEEVAPPASPEAL